MNRMRGFTVGWVLLVIVVVALGAVGWFVFARDGDKTSTQVATNTSDKSEAGLNPQFTTPKKSAHYESNTPAHGSILAAVPVDIVINFNFDLDPISTIKITKDGKDYGTGDVTVDANKLAMRRAMDKSAGSGVYTVEYNACWPDKSCHDGHFQFAVDTNLQSSYDDKRNQPTVTIKLSELKFRPMNLLISAGTTVTWINDDSVEHYVNTDSHPAHTHVPGLNSKALSKGQSYSFKFENTGAYPYHCSAHAADMTGNIVVI